MSTGKHGNGTGAALLLAGTLAGGAWAAAGAAPGLEAAGPAAVAEAAAAAPAMHASAKSAFAQPASGPAAHGRMVRDGVSIEFEARPARGSAGLVEGQVADFRFRITDAVSGQPLKGLNPGAWIDISHEVAGSDRKPLDCREKIGLYMKGLVGVRPTLDLNSYYLLVLNQDPSITVIDPIVSVGGVTSTLSRIVLKRPPVDWVKSRDGKRMFVSMPLAGQVAVVDLEGFSVLRDVDAGADPTRVALQPDGRQLWVGNNAREAGKSGVTVIDAHTLEVKLRAATGRGHHEIAFSDDSRVALVSSRDEGTVQAFDAAKLVATKTLRTGPRPISVAYSALSKAFYVADAQAGTITVVDARTLDTRKVVAAKPGLGPLRFTSDGRYGFALNPLENTATILDAGSDEAIHTIDVSAEPYQVSFTSAYAYVRGLSSERVTMVALSSLGSGRKPALQYFAAGAEPPKLAGNLPLADGVTMARDEAAVFVVNPANNTTYFYMEGMNAPMAGYANRGHSARAAAVVDRSLREVEPGVFASQVRMPGAGRFDVAFLLDRPQLTHCFSAEAAADPLLASQARAPKVQFVANPAPVAAGGLAPVRFRVLQGRDDSPRPGVEDLRIRYFLAPSSPVRESTVREVGNGEYEAMLQVDQAGAYYVHVASSSLGIRFGDQPYTTVRAK